MNMQPPDALIRRGVTSLPTIGDGRQSGTSDSPSILNASPEAAVGGGLLLLQTGDRICIDLNKGRCDVLLTDAELAARRSAPPRPIAPANTPWEQIYRRTVGQLSEGAVIEEAVAFRGTARKLPRHNH